MEKQVNMPKLRFQEFEGAWVKKCLGDIGEVKMCKRIFNEETLPIGDIPFYKIGSFGKLADAFISKELYSEYRSRFSFPKKGDILISAAGTIGRTVVYNGEDAYYQDSNIVWIDNDNSSVSNEFLFFIFQIVKYNTEGGTIQRLYNGILRSTKFSSPTLSEQSKIANFLSRVDDKLAQLKKKQSLLEQYKGSIMQKLFSQVLRFKNDDGNDYPDWMDKSLGEVGKFVGGGTPSTKDAENWKGCVPWISSSDLTDNSIFKIKTSRFISEDAIFNSATKIVPANSVLIVSRVGVGKVAVNESELCTSQDFTSLIPFKDNPIFLAYLVKLKTNSLLGFNQGTSIKGFVKSDLETMKIKLPCLEEQQKIASFLSALDDKIAQTALQIEKMQLWKKGLLQQMFV